MNDSVVSVHVKHTRISLGTQLKTVLPTAMYKLKIQLIHNYHECIHYIISVEYILYCFNLFFLYFFPLTICTLKQLISILYNSIFFFFFLYLILVVKSSG